MVVIKEEILTSDRCSLFAIYYTQTKPSCQIHEVLLLKVPLVGEVQVAAALGAEYPEKVVAFQGQVNLSFESGAEVQFLLEEEQTVFAGQGEGADFFPDETDVVFGADHFSAVLAEQ